MTVPLFAVFAAVVVPVGLLGWLLHTWPGEIAASSLYRVRDAAWDEGRHEDADRYDTVLDTFGYSKAPSAQRYWSPSWVLAAHADPVDDVDGVHRHIAAAWARSSLTAMLLTAGLFCTVAARTPRHPSTWRSRTGDALARRVAGHEAYLARNQVALRDAGTAIAAAGRTR
jgi:hypothetical protein